MDMINYFIHVLSPVLGGSDLMNCLYAELGIIHNCRASPSNIDIDDIAGVLIQLNVMKTYLGKKGISYTLSKSITNEITRLNDIILSNQSKFDNNDYQRSLDQLANNFNSFIERVGRMNSRPEIVSEFNRLKNHVYQFYYEFGRMFANIKKNEQAIMDSIKIGSYWIDQVNSQSYIDVNCINMLVIEVIKLASTLRIELHYQ